MPRLRPGQRHLLGDQHLGHRRLGLPALRDRVDHHRLRTREVAVVERWVLVTASRQRMRASLLWHENG